MFISYEVLVWIFDKLWGFVINLVLAPIAILGLTLDYLRHWARRVSIFLVILSLYSSRLTPVALNNSILSFYSAQDAKIETI